MPRKKKEAIIEASPETTIEPSIEAVTEPTGSRQARKKKQPLTEPLIEAVTEPTIETQIEAVTEAAPPQIDYSELWFAERIGSKVNAVLGKNITKNPVLYHCFTGPFQTKEECLVAVEKNQALVQKEVNKFKAVLAAEPEPIPFEKKKTISEESLAEPKKK